MPSHLRAAKPRYDSLGHTCAANVHAVTSCNLTAGALVGPPWEKRQNGYLLRETVSGGVSLFYEPHCDYSGDSVQRVVPGPVDVLVAPVLNQDLIAYPLVRFTRRIEGP